MNGTSDIDLTSVDQKRRILRDFDWSAKLVFNCDTTIESARPIVQLSLHFVDQSTSVYEFTADELSQFLNKLKEILQ